jgi:hypothetical protein
MRMEVIKPLALYCAIASLMALPALAQDQCAPLADALAGLAANYDEAPRITAMMGESLLIITAAPAGGWTALEVKPTGEACIVAVGEAFEVQDAPKPGSDT